MSPKFAKTLRILSMVVFGLMLGYVVYITQRNNKLKDELSQTKVNLDRLRKITSTIPSVNLGQVLKNEPIYLPGEKVPIYHDKFIDNPATLKKLAISDSTLQKIMTALKLKDKDINNITNLYTSVNAENLKLKQKTNSKEFEYVDKYIYIRINDSTKVVNNIKVTNDLSLINYSKRKWLLGSKEYFTSVISKSPYLDIDSIGKISSPNPKTVFSLYLDNRYYNDIKTFDDGFLTSTINAEINPDNTISWLVGVGIKSNLIYVKTIAVAGVKINLWRIRR